MRESTITPTAAVRSRPDVVRINKLLRSKLRSIPSGKFVHSFASPSQQAARYSRSLNRNGHAISEHANGTGKITPLQRESELVGNAASASRNGHAVIDFDSYRRSNQMWKRGTGETLYGKGKRAGIISAERGISRRRKQIRELDEQFAEERRDLQAMVRHGFMTIDEYKSETTAMHVLRRKLAKKQTGARNALRREKRVLVIR